MRHSVFGKKLSRDTNARKALLSNLVSPLLTSGQITTTQAKAKFARPYAERLITIAKKNKLSAHRFLSARLTQSAFKRLTSEIGPGFSERSGGYTRIIKLGRPRRGDTASMARLELLKWEKGITKDTEKKSRKVQKKVTSVIKSQRKSAREPSKSKNEKH